MQQEEDNFFAQEEAVLATSLEAKAEYGPGWEAFTTIAYEMEDAMFPAGHYLGRRMVQTMEAVHPRDRVVRCVQHQPEFRPLYDEAALNVEAFVFSAYWAD